MFEFHFERFTPYHKKKVMEFLDSLSLHTRDMLSVSGVDPKSIYHSFREDWMNSGPVVLYHEDEVIAIGKLTEWNNGLYLSCLVVKDNYQRKGFGTKLVKYMFALAILNGSLKMYLEVRTDNPGGISFFKSLGFHITKELTMTYLMERKLI